MRDANIGCIRGVLRRPSEAARDEGRKHRVHQRSPQETIRGSPMHSEQTRCNQGQHRRAQTHSDALRRTQTHSDALRRTQTHSDALRRTQTQAGPSRRKQARTALNTLAFRNDLRIDLRRAPRDDCPKGDGVLDDRELSETAQPGDCGVFIAAPRGDSVSVKADCGVWNASR